MNILHIVTTVVKAMCYSSSLAASICCQYKYLFVHRTTRQKAMYSRALHDITNTQHTNNTIHGIPVGISIRSSSNPLGSINGGTVEVVT